jgi:Heterokaryon incompatibility protein (HET)
MWLINTSTLSLESFYGDAIPAYAILSHTWGEGEVSFQEFTQVSESMRDGITSNPGYRKIIATCAQALGDGYSYAWVDTCCIDKTSSAELIEAINSMFGWYRQSEVCYVYLSDFELVNGDREQFYAEFGRCRWFTRGWCLQELLAPRQLRFFNKKWQDIGEKSLLALLISEITGIPGSVLSVPPKKDIQEFPIAARISWIGKRQTTRIEDMSYSLLGILNVNMPMLYGEGSKAFLRLQEEIIKKYNDLSIFAWNGGVRGSSFMHVLAAKPADFAINPEDHNRRNTGSQLGDRLRMQFSITNQGVFFPSAKLQYQPGIPGYRHQYILDLNYHDPSFRGIGGKQRYILLQKVGPGLFVRLHDPPERLRAFQKIRCTSAFSEPVCILNNLQKPMIRQLILWERYAVRLRWKPWEKLGRRYWHIRAAEPRGSWDMAANQFLTEMSYERHMQIEFVPGNYESNPSFKYFVLVIQVGDEKRRDPAVVSARIVSADVWEGVTVTMLGFRKKEALALEAMSPETGTRISLVGYDISVSVRLVTEPNEQPFNLVYLDWEEGPSSDVTTQ